MNEKSILNDLTIIKQSLDAAIKGGIFPNIETGKEVFNAFNNLVDFCKLQFSNNVNNDGTN
jgi:hypothetical protein